MSEFTIIGHYKAIFVASAKFTPHEYQYQVLKTGNATKIQKFIDELMQHHRVNNYQVTTYSISVTEFAELASRVLTAWPANPDYVDVIAYNYYTKELGFNIQDVASRRITHGSRIITNKLS
ncbi:hypothetical protein [Lactiplantibacillus herbarum]|uniref:hypothetical protein n=1 Tax=Lactiplantibacillus herbarum TaxID=1670446 RepID=UPI00064ED704|nr:hypothetical protein [Lactiplantibacillus herbarum]